jgi:hypothetical protein
VLLLCTVLAGVTLDAAPFSKAIVDLYSWADRSQDPYVFRAYSDENGGAGFTQSSAFRHVTGNDGFGSFDLRGSTAVSPDSLKAGLWLNYQNYQSGAFRASNTYLPTRGNASGYIIDSVFLSGAPASSTVHFTYRIQGTLAETESGFPNTYRGLTVGVSDYTTGTNRQTGYKLHNYRADQQSIDESATFDFVFENPAESHEFRWFIYALAAGADYFPSNPSLTYSLNSAMDFTHTASLQEVLVTDSQGNPVQGARLVSGSGYEFQMSPLNTVPEPATVFSVMAGLALVLWRRSRL